MTQTIVEPQGIGLSSAYPFESGSITSAKTTDAKDRGRFRRGRRRQLLLLADGRRRRARPVHPRHGVVSRSSGQPDVEMNAGGFQVGAGLRIRIPSPKSAKPKPPAPAASRSRRPRRRGRSKCGWMQAMATNDRVVDAVLVGGGVMSATVGALLKELEPGLVDRGLRTPRRHLAGEFARLQQRRHRPRRVLRVELHAPASGRLGRRLQGAEDQRAVPGVPAVLGLPGVAGPLHDAARVHQRGAARQLRARRRGRGVPAAAVRGAVRPSAVRGDGVLAGPRRSWPSGCRS